MKRQLLSLSLCLLGCTATAHAGEFVTGFALVNPEMSGQTQYDGWIGLTVANYPGYGAFPGTAPWPQAIGSNRTADNSFNREEPGDATLLKVANGTGGGPYPATMGLYYGGFSGEFDNDGGTLEVADLSPVADLRNVIFQVQIGEAWTYDFFNDVLPVLSYNGGEQELEPTSSVIIDRYFNGTVTMPTGEEDIYINTWLVQWDLSSIDATIDQFAVRFTGVQHGLTYAMRLDQSDVYTPYGETCAADLNGDGVVDFADYLEFLNLYDGQDPRADFNQDGVIDFADYLEFLNLFDAGC